MKEKEKAIAEKAILDTYGRAPLFVDLRINLVLEGDVLVAPDGFNGLASYDSATGKRLWQTPNVVDRRANPAIWRKDGKSYLVCGIGSLKGEYSLLDTRDGRVLWTHEVAGPAHMGAIVSGDIALFNTKGYGQNAGAPSENKDRAGVFGGFELSTGGAKKLWEMDDVPENWTEVRPDIGRIRRAIVHDGVAYMVIGNLAPINDNPSRRNYPVSVDLKSGKVIQRGTTPMPVFAGTPYAVENRVIVAGNVGHSWYEVHFFDFKLKQNGAFEPAPQPYLPAKAGVFFVTEYEAPIEFAWWKGRMVGKTRKGLVCLDLRKP